MRKYIPSIKIAVNNDSGEIVDAIKYFNNKKDSSVIRTQYNRDEIEFSCYQCGQELGVPSSKNHNHHFRHKPNSGYCDLKDEELSQKEKDILNNILACKESQRHKDLKNTIAEKLCNVKGIDVSSIAIDNKYIIRGDEKRRPDVYCKYYDKELVFEIQLSDLSQRYLLSRYDFYKKHGMYLIWILENFDIHNQGRMELDIKYLTAYENFFNFDESSVDFKLKCKFKYPVLTESNEIITPWKEKSVSLEKIKFDTELYQIYYCNPIEIKEKIKDKQKRNDEALRIAKINKDNQDRKISENKVKNIINSIKELKDSKSEYFYKANELIDELNDYELNLLNSQFKLCEPSNKKIFSWIDEVKKDNDLYPFFEFILTCSPIKLDVNIRSCEGKTMFQYLYASSSLKIWVSNNLIRLLFKRGYNLKEDDKAYFQFLNNISQDNKNEWLLFNFCNRLRDRYYVDDIFNDKYSKVFCVVESAKRKEIVGFNYMANEWVSFANNAATYYTDYWKYIERAFKEYELWEKLLILDKNKTFIKKAKAVSYDPDELISEEKSDELRRFERIYYDLFPDLYW
ncbi:MAG: hypothetical protein HOP36_05690 [Methyloglobulus sp.]|nr:hypothetical protein [Methyloglobulus sp.]